MRDQTKAIAIFASDLHLSEKAPVARSAEPDWFAAQQRHLVELAELQDRVDAPIFYAGDIFDKSNPSPRLINWAIDHLPRGYAIPGQHDLPFHRLEDIKDSGYWTLCRTTVLTNIQDTITLDLGKILVRAFPWGHEIEPFPRSRPRG